MDTEREPSRLPWWQAALDWQYETSRTALEQALELQRSAIDGWMGFAESAVADSRSSRSVLRGLEWSYDLWEETIRNVLVHLDDAIGEEGIDLDALQMIWLHAMDDAFSEVTSRPAFATEASRNLERVLGEQRSLNEARRDLLHDSDLPTDRDLEVIGERLLRLEASQKRIEDRLDAILEDFGVEATPRIEVPE